MSFAFDGINSPPRQCRWQSRIKSKTLPFRGRGRNRQLIQISEPPLTKSLHHSSLHHSSLHHFITGIVQKIVSTADCAPYPWRGVYSDNVDNCLLTIELCIWRNKFSFRGRGLKGELTQISEPTLTKSLHHSSLHHFIAGIVQKTVSTPDYSPYPWRGVYSNNVYNFLLTIELCIRRNKFSLRGRGLKGELTQISEPTLTKSLHHSITPSLHRWNCSENRVNCRLRPLRLKRSLFE